MAKKKKSSEAEDVEVTAEVDANVESTESSEVAAETETPVAEEPKVEEPAAEKTETPAVKEPKSEKTATVDSEFTAEEQAKIDAYAGPRVAYGKIVPTHIKGRPYAQPVHTAYEHPEFAEFKRDLKSSRKTK